MTIKAKKARRGKIEIDLTGPDGNVFVLMGYATRYAKQLKLDGKKITAVMMESDYEHALQVFDDYFGEYVDLLR